MKNIWFIVFMTLSYCFGFATQAWPKRIATFPLAGDGSCVGCQAGITDMTPVAGPVFNTTPNCTPSPMAGSFSDASTGTWYYTNPSLAAALTTTANSWGMGFTIILDGLTDYPHVYAGGTTNYFIYYTGSGFYWAGGTSSAMLSANSFSTGTCYVIELKYDGSSATMWVDGVVEGSVQTTSFAWSQNDFVLGTNIPTGYGFTGKIKNLWVDDLTPTIEVSSTTTPTDTPTWTPTWTPTATPTWTPTTTGTWTPTASPTPRNIYRFASYGHSFVSGTLEGGGGGGDSYRLGLYNRFFSLGKTAQFVGDYTIGSGVPYPYTNGVSGQISSDMAISVTASIANVLPNPNQYDNVLLGPIEQNDWGYQDTTTSVRVGIEDSVEAIYAYSPLIKVFIITGAQPDNLYSLNPGPPQNYSLYLAASRQAYVNEMVKGRNVWLIDWGVSTDLLWDTATAHPKYPEGYLAFGQFISYKLEQYLFNIQIRELKIKNKRGLYLRGRL